MNAVVAKAVHNLHLICVEMKFHLWRIWIKCSSDWSGMLCTATHLLNIILHYQTSVIEGLHFVDSRLNPSTLPVKWPWEYPMTLTEQHPGIINPYPNHQEDRCCNHHILISYRIYGDNSSVFVYCRHKVHKLYVCILVSVLPTYTSTFQFCYEVYISN
jgi:hypothetical protein